MKNSPNPSLSLGGARGGNPNLSPLNPPQGDEGGGQGNKEKRLHNRNKILSPWGAIAES